MKMDNNKILSEDNECNINKKLLEISRKNPKIVITHPLISVRIATFNRAKLLVERAIPSVLRQTYQNFEIIIVGDHCTDDTEELLKKLYDNDKRIKFYNLPKRGDYPNNPLDRWRVAGTEPANNAIDLCTGDWIAPLDDDDEFSEDHLEVLLEYALKHGYEMVYGKVLRQQAANTWIPLGSFPLANSQICHLSVLYSSKLKFFKYDINAWKIQEPGDWNLWKRMKNAGVKIGFIDRIIGKHYLEKRQYGI